MVAGQNNKRLRTIMTGSDSNTLILIWSMNMILISFQKKEWKGLYFRRIASG